MNASDEARTLRRRLEDLERALARRTEAAGSAPSALLITVTVASYPSGTQKYFGVRRVRPGGTESEGATPSLTAFGPKFYAVNTGKSNPAVGTYVIGVMDGGRWVFNYG